MSSDDETTNQDINSNTVLRPDAVVQPSAILRPHQALRSAISNLTNDETTNQDTNSNTMDKLLNWLKSLLKAVENGFIKSRSICIVLEELKNPPKKEAVASNNETRNQDTMNEWLKSTMKLLIAVENRHIRSRSIFRVIDKLTNPSNNDDIASDDETTGQDTDTMNKWSVCTKRLQEAVQNGSIQPPSISIVQEAMASIDETTKKDINTMNEWLNCTETLLQAVDNGYIQSRSISIVPKELINSSNKDSYMPRVVSIGPRFKGTREDLLLMEEVKLRSMLYLMHRAGKPNESGIYFRKCGQAIWKSVEEIRASYVYNIKLTKKELADIMIMDGCFLLELMIAKDYTLNSKYPCRWDQPSPAPKVLKDEDVLSDIILLENQIPILVLHKLSQALFPDSFKDSEVQAAPMDRAKKINNLFLSILGYSPHSQLSNPIYLNAPHILDNVHYFVNSTTNGKSESNAVCDYVVPITNAQHMMPKLKRCALRLQAAGVTIKLAEETGSKISCFGFLRNCFGGIFIKIGSMIVTNNQVDEPIEVNGLDFYFKFKNGKLEISKLHITKTTKAKWLNIIAWEHHKNNWKCAISPDSERGDDNQVHMSSLSRKFTLSALIFDALICCAADVKLLKEKNIIVDHLKMTNEKLEEFFHTMVLGLDSGIVDSSHVELVNNLNSYSSSHSFFIVRIFKIFRHLYKYRLEWLVNFFKKNYNFVAALLAVLTLVQTVYTVLSYHLPK